MEPPQTENNDEKSNIDINEDLLNDDANQNDENLNENNPETNEIETETNPIQTEDNPLILPPITNININPSTENKEPSSLMNNNESPSNVIPLEEDHNNSEIDANDVIQSKYHTYTLEELRAELKEKNNSISQLYTEKDISKKELNTLIKKLNTLISDNIDILYNKEPNPQIMKKLQQTITLRTNELNYTKKLNQQYHNDYITIANRAKENFSTEKLKEIEIQIQEIKQNNVLLTRQIREMKARSVIKAKELEICTANKKYPQQLKACTQEMKSLRSKKHDCHEKLTRNMKSLDNTLKELEVLQKMYDADIDEQCDQTIVNKINEWMDIITNELKGSKEEILNRVMENKSEFLNIINTDINKKLVQQKNERKQEMMLPAIKGKSLSPLSSQKATRNYNSMSVNIVKNNNKKVYQGVFSKFNYLQRLNAKPTSSKSPRYIVVSKTSGNEETKITNNTNDEDILLIDYNNASEEDYKILLNKKEQYVKMNERIEKSMKDYEKQTKRKLLDVENTVVDNQIKLDQLNEANETMKTEIENLEKIYKLTNEQIKLQKQVKHKENQIAQSKSLQQLDIQNNEQKQLQQQEGNIIDPSMTGNELLQEMQKGENVMVEEMRQDSERNVKCKFNYIYIRINMFIVPDISNVEKEEEDLVNDREKRLKIIKDKYMNNDYEEDEDELDEA